MEVSGEIVNRENDCERGAKFEDFAPCLYLQKNFLAEKFSCRKCKFIRLYVIESYTEIRYD